MPEQDIVNLVALIIPIISTLLTGHFASQTASAKNKVSKIKEAVDAIDKALEDDTISESEFRTIYYKITAIVRP